MGAAMISVSIEELYVALAGEQQRTAQLVRNLLATPNVDGVFFGPLREASEALGWCFYGAGMQSLEAAQAEAQRMLKVVSHYRKAAVEQPVSASERIIAEAANTGKSLGAAAQALGYSRNAGYKARRDREAGHPVCPHCGQRVRRSYVTAQAVP